MRVRHGALLAAMVLAARNHAQSDVLAYVDGNGDLWMIGDDGDTHVRVQAGGEDTDTFRVRGLDAGTTVNGLAEVTFIAPGTRMVLVLGAGDNLALMGTDYGGNPSCCQRDLVVIGGAGADELVMVGGFPHVTADLGPGNDRLSVAEGAGAFVGTLLTGDGDDRVEADTYTTLSGSFDLGDGADRIVTHEAWLAGVFELGAGDDVVRLDDESGGRFELRAGPGDDALTLVDFRGDWIVVDAGAGHDRVAIDGVVPAGPTDPLDVALGPGDDELELGELAIGRAVLDGGVGHDVLRRREQTRFAFPPDLRGFERPNAAPLAPLETPTFVFGTVVDEDGMPVPGATVLLPDLGRATTTDAAGGFVIDELAADGRRVELVAGATWRGRARTAAAVVLLAAYQGSPAGTLVLDVRRRNTLAFGATAGRAAALETNLRALGWRPEEVSRLAALPSDLAPYGTIWHVGGPISAGDAARLVAFVKAGGGLHLSGTSILVNDTVEPIVDALVRTGNVTLDVAGATSGPLVFEPDAVGGVARTPNALADFDGVSVRRFLGGLAERNVLARFPISGQRFAAAWEPSDLAGARGHVTLIMDDSWIRAGARLDIVENLQRFLARSALAAPR